MKPWLVLSLLSSLMLVGCIEDPKTTASSGSQGYGVSYSGQTSWAMLETMAEVEAFVKVFELHHRNQALMDNWPIQLVELTPDADLTAFNIDSCSEDSTISFQLEMTGQADGETEVETTGFNNQVTLAEYCLPDEALDAHPIENGTVVVLGDADAYTAGFSAYRKEIPDLYEVRFGGQVLFKPSASNPSRIYDLVIFQNQDPALVAKYEDFKVSEGTDGQFYTGIFYHPNYGKVSVTTDAQVVTADDDVFVNRPTSGTLKLTSGDHSARIIFSAASYNVELDLGDDGVVDDELQDQTWPSIP